MNKGSIAQIIGPVVDVKFPEGSVPHIYNALKVKDLILEVEQELGEVEVRAVAMGQTEGLKRGMEVEDLGKPISVPVGEVALGRLFNVLGEPIDHLDPIKTKELLVERLPSLAAEARFIADKLREARKAGTAWKDMAVLYRQKSVEKFVQQALDVGKIPWSGKDDIRLGDTQDTVKLLTFHSSKGLEFPVVAIPTGGALAGREKLTAEELRLLYVAITRATDLLIVTETKRS